MKGVYFITSSQLREATGSSAFKIGFSKQIGVRLGQLQCGNPYKLEIYKVVEAGRALEHYLHQRLSSYKVSGEWYKLDVGQIDVLCTMINAEDFPYEIANNEPSDEDSLEQ